MGPWPHTGSLRRQTGDRAVARQGCPYRAGRRRRHPRVTRPPFPDPDPADTARLREWLARLHSGPVPAAWEAEWESVAADIDAVPDAEARATLAAAIELMRQSGYLVAAWFAAVDGGEPDAEQHLWQALGRIWAMPATIRDEEG